MSRRCSDDSAKKQAAVVPFDVESSSSTYAADDGDGALSSDLPAPSRCCDWICNNCLCHGVVFGGNPCCGMRVASIVCNVIAIVLTAFNVMIVTLSMEEEFWNDGYPDADAMSPEERNEIASFKAYIERFYHLGLAFSFAAFPCLVMAIVGNVNYQWKLVAPLLILPFVRVLAFALFSPPFIVDFFIVYLLLLSYPNWRFVWEMRKGILTRPAISGHQSLPTEDTATWPSGRNSFE
mmetsp:Transcript_5746/g.9702  ORF Transcript_5746/g.9702 Transcript_5746/m.9702 type:complete len:236 (-) Transcript_5746:43-750(-)|eukprot:CAMPEP_0197725902 /NCGR_PEP_ID=MMETSP1434-20131217/11870_1 /TAXON_ID=265543 /ORGANISM="Minutocellus polymorphus, Strain CCMP3303" /LENGTH=235 /DNA_ID=CAMNT_0043311639 /DNA_START=95 /DNA_END=802 /DNA_ORIENTATION=+